MQTKTESPRHVSAEQWWTHHAELLAAKMKVGGIKSFRIELNARGNYEFEVVPTATPNAAMSDCAGGKLES